jgi:hypothetical protein
MDRYFPSVNMSLTELKRSAVDLPESERRELAAFLLQLGRERNETWREEMSRRMNEMDAGKKVSQAEFERRIGLSKD